MLGMKNPMKETSQGAYVSGQQYVKALSRLSLTVQNHDATMHTTSNGC